MGKLLCDSTTVAEAFPTSPPALPWREPPKSSPTSVESVEAVDFSDETTWDTVLGLEEQQRRQLQKLQTKGVLWKNGERTQVFRLSHGGEVSADGNCLFTASKNAMGAAASGFDARELRRRVVGRFLQDYGSATADEREMAENAIQHMYAPDLKSGWGVHVVQEVKLLAKKEEREAMDSTIEELMNLGMQRYIFIFLVLLF